MTRGRRGEATYSGPNGAREFRLRAMALLAKGSPGTSQPVIPPSQEAMRRTVAAGMCPFCRRGPFMNIAGHVNPAHGLDRLEFRELLGVFKMTSICDPGHAENLRASNVARGHRPTGGPGATRRKYSAAGRAAQREKALLSVAKGSPTLASAASATKTLERNAAKHAKAAEMWREGGHNFREIAAIVDMHPRSVRNLLRRVGLLGDADGRALRWQRGPHVIEGVTLTAQEVML